MNRLIVIIACLPFFIIAAYFLIISYQHHRRKKYYCTIKTLETSSQDLVIDREYGVTDARFRLKEKNFSTASRTDILLHIASYVDSKQSNLLMREVLLDSQEELRLLAFGGLEQQSKAITAQINQLLKQLPTIQTVTAKAETEKKIAGLYWELVYRSLSAPELQKIVLQRALKFAEAAHAVFTTDQALETLIIKIYHKLGLERSIKKLTLLTNNKTNLGFYYLPYVAEYFFSQRDFKMVAKLLQLEPTLLDIPLIDQVAAFWSNH